MKPRIYVASRASIPARSAMWRALRASGVDITSSWIDEAGEGQTADLAELWTRIEMEIADSDALILYVEKNDFPLKGAFIEVGIAFALHLPITVVMRDFEPEAPSYRPIGSWIMHPRVKVFKHLNEAVYDVTMTYRRNRHL